MPITSRQQKQRTKYALNQPKNNSSTQALGESTGAIRPEARMWIPAEQMALYMKLQELLEEVKKINEKLGKKQY